MTSSLRVIERRASSLDRRRATRSGRRFTDPKHVAVEVGEQDSVTSGPDDSPSSATSFSRTLHGRSSGRELQDHEGRQRLFDICGM
jgi:hypothetical protein